MLPLGGQTLVPNYHPLQQILEHVKPDYVHVLIDGKIVRVVGLNSP